MKPLFVVLYMSSAAGLRVQALQAVESVARRPKPVLALGLDNLPALDDAALSATIGALRRSREIGVRMLLVTANAAHRRRLTDSGLDGIFEVISDAEGTDSL